MVDHWEERNQAVSDALVLYTDLIHFRDLTDISSKYIDIHKDLKRKIQARLDGGVAEHSELSLITIRLQELLLQEATDLRAMEACLLYTSPSPRDGLLSRMPSSA